MSCSTPGFSRLAQRKVFRWSRRVWPRSRALLRNTWRRTEWERWFNLFMPCSFFSFSVYFVPCSWTNSAHPRVPIDPIHVWSTALKLGPRWASVVHTHKIMTDGMQAVKASFQRANYFYLIIRIRCTMRLSAPCAVDGGSGNLRRSVLKVESHGAKQPVHIWWIYRHLLIMCTALLQIRLFIRTRCK